MLKNGCIICKRKFEGLITCSKECEKELAKITTIIIVSKIIMEVIEKLEEKK